MVTTTGSPASGELLGPFRIGRRLGVGGMGMVFAAVDTHLGRPVALKIINPHLAEDPGFRARFTREAQAQASLDSPHVAQVYSFGEADGRLYIASQLIPDGDLGQMLHRHGAPPARTGLRLIAQVADGLADAHEAGLVHRDVKPANVLLRVRGSSIDAFIADFGIARQVDAEQALTQVGGTVGTPTYMAPELHTGGSAGPSSDIYSLGCLLWAVLSGRAPYVASSDYLVVKGHLEQPVPQVYETSALAVEINRVLRTALAKDPAERYPTAAALRDDLEGLLAMPDDHESISMPGGAESGVPATRASWPSAATPTPSPITGAGPVPGARTSSGTGSRRGWLIGAVVALLVAAVVVVAVLASGGSGGSGGDRDQRAIAAVSAGYMHNFGIDQASGTCIATSMVQAVGVDQLVQAGILDTGLQFHTVPLTPGSAVDDAFRTAVVACVAPSMAGQMESGS